MPPSAKSVRFQPEKSVQQGRLSTPTWSHAMTSGILPRLQVFFNIYKLITVICHINQAKNKNYMIISTDTEKTWQNPILIWLILSRKCTKRTYLNTVKAICDQPTATSCSIVKSWKHFLYHQKQDKDVHSYINDEKELAMQISKEKHSRQRKKQKWKRGSHIWGTERRTGSLVYHEWTAKW